MSIFYPTVNIAHPLCDFMEPFQTSLSANSIGLVLSYNPTSLKRNVDFPSEKQIPLVPQKIKFSVNVSCG